MKRCLLLIALLLSAVAVGAQTSVGWNHFSPARADWVAAARSVVVPGWGQMGKGYLGEGIVTLAGEAVVVGGAVATYYWGRSVVEDMKAPGIDAQTHIALHRRYRNATTVNHILWGTAATLWAANVIRAFFAEPDQHRLASLSLGFIPTPTEPLPSIGLSFSL